MANDDFLSLVDLDGQAKQGINKGGNIELIGIVGQRVEDGLETEMRIGEGVDGEFVGAFEGGTVGADMEVDGIDGGSHRRIIKDKIVFI